MLQMLPKIQFVAKFIMPGAVETNFHQGSWNFRQTYFRVSIMNSRVLMIQIVHLVLQSLSEEINSSPKLNHFLVLHRKYLYTKSIVITPNYLFCLKTTTVSFEMTRVILDFFYYAFRCGILEYKIFFCVVLKLQSWCYEKTSSIWIKLKFTKVNRVIHDQFD